MTKTSTGSFVPGTRLYAVDEVGRPLGTYVVDSGASNGYRVEEEYVHLDGWRPVAVVRPDAATGMANPKVFPILTDHLGTPRKVLDGDTGETRWAWDAKQPFGHELPNETPTSGLPAFAFDLRFPGQRYDSETGLFHNGFRDYHPGLGRYVQSDLLGLEAGWNTFAYAENQPGMLMDPYGLDPFFDLVHHFQMPHLPQGFVDFSAGIGDDLSLGITGYARSKLGLGLVDECSTSYSAGGLAAALVTLPKSAIVKTARQAPTLAKYSVGAYDSMTGKVPGLDAHHVGQSALMKRMIPGWDHHSAPAILVPKEGHTRKNSKGQILARTSWGNGPSTPR